MNAEEHLQRNYEELEYSSAMSAICLIRFISDHLSDLSVQIVH